MLSLAGSKEMCACIEKKLGPCEYTSVFDFPEASDEDVDRFVDAIKKAIG